jgi:hypothetical protein
MKNTLDLPGSHNLTQEQHDQVRFLLENFSEHLWYIPGEIYLLLEHCIAVITNSFARQTKLVMLGKKKDYPHGNIAGMGVVGSWGGLGGAIRLITGNIDPMSDLDYFVFLPPDKTFLTGAVEIDALVQQALYGKTPGYTCQNLNASNVDSQLPISITYAEALRLLNCIADVNETHLLQAGFRYLDYFRPVVMADKTAEEQLEVTRHVLLTALKAHPEKEYILENLVDLWIRSRGIKPKHLGLEKSPENVIAIEHINRYLADKYFESLIG